MRCFATKVPLTADVFGLAIIIQPDKEASDQVYESEAFTATDPSGFRDAAPQPGPGEGYEVRIDCKSGEVNRICCEFSVNHWWKFRSILIDFFYGRDGPVRSGFAEGAGGF